MKLREEPGRGQRGARGAQAATRSGPTPGRARGRLGPLVHLWLPPSPIYPPSRENSRTRTLFRELASVPPPPRFQDREHQKTSSRHPAGGRIDLRESPLHHGCSPDVSWVVFLRPWVRDQ